MATPRGWVLYDGGCGICARWVPWLAPTLARLDLATAALQEPWVAARTGLGPAALLRDISILFADGRLMRGADAYRWVLRRLRWAFPLWLFAILPPSRWVFDLGYRSFARRRHQWSQACGLEPR